MLWRWGGFGPEQGARHRCDKGVTSPGIVGDVASPRAAIAERLAQRRDVNPERPLVDDRIGVAGGGQRVVLHRPDGLSVAALPGDFLHYSTVQRYFYAWRDDGTLQRINFELLVPRNAERHQIGLLGDIIADSRATSPGK
jgi:hypothetical protein